MRQPLSQVRLSLAASLGTGQIIFLAGINAKGDEVSTSFEDQLKSPLHYPFPANDCLSMKKTMRLHNAREFFKLLFHSFFICIIVIDVYYLDS